MTVSAAPAAIRHCVVPAHAHYREIVRAEGRRAPVARMFVSRVDEKRGVLEARYRKDRQMKRVHLHTVHRALVFLSRVAAHQKRAFRNRRETVEHHSPAGAPSTTRCRPYFRTKRSVSPGATALRIARPREIPYGYTSGRGRFTQLTIARATSSTVCFGPRPLMRCP